MVILVPFLFAVGIWLVLMYTQRNGVSATSDAIWTGYVAVGAISVLIGASSLVIFVSGVSMILAAMVCHFFKLYGVRFAAITFVMIPFTFLWMGYLAWSHVERLAERKQEYPFQSLENRLAYETTHHTELERNVSEDLSGQRSLETINFVNQVDRQVQYGGELREMMLEELHQSQLNAFARSPGFGPVRGIRYYSEEQLLTEPRPRITPPSAPQAPYVPDTGEAAPPIAAEQELELQTVASEPAAPFDREKLQQLHLASAIDFVNPQGFGLVRSLQEVAGFEPHAFSKMPELPKYSDQSSSPCGGEHPSQPAASDEDWVIVSLQLVSLLKHEKPLVYATKDLPQMEVLTSEDMPTRELNAFEAEALPQVLQGESLVVQESANRIHMLGAVRAGETCSKCHQVPRLSLLGAFSYELARTQPVPEKPVAPAAGPEL